MKKDIAIIGYGRFGNLATDNVKKHFVISIYNLNN